MFYYLMLAFLIFVAFSFHIIMAHVADHLLEETGWWKPKYRKYLIIPGLPELISAVILIVIVGIVIYSYVTDLFED